VAYLVVGGKQREQTRVTPTSESPGLGATAAHVVQMESGRADGSEDGAQVEDQVVPLLGILGGQ